MMSSKNLLMISIILIITSLILNACSSSPSESKKIASSIKTQTQSFEYLDSNGVYSIKREVKVADKKLYVRTQMTSGQTSEQLEKTVSVSTLGMIKTKNGKLMGSLPFASQYEVWLEGKRHFVQLKTQKESKSLIATYDPAYDGKKTQKFLFPSANLFCFFSQIPECIKRVGFIEQAAGKNIGSLSFYIIWDQFPYMNDLYGGNLQLPFENARFSYNAEVDGEYKFVLETSRFIMFYHFDKSYEFQKFFWVANGLSMKRI